MARDALAGCVGGVFLSSTILLRILMQVWQGNPESALPFNASASVSDTLIMLIGAIFLSLGLLCLLFLLRVVLRSEKVAFVVWVLFTVLVTYLAVNNWIFWLTNMLLSALMLFLLMRFGFVSLTLTFFVYFLIITTPITSDASAWYSRSGYAALAIFAVIVLYAFYNSLGGRPIFGTPRLDD